MNDQKTKKKVIILDAAYKAGFMSLFNACIGQVCGIYYFCSYGLTEDTWCTSFEKIVCMIQIGYFLVDMMMGMYCGYIGVVMFFHHVLGFLGYCYPVFYNRFGSESIMVLAIAELSGPFLALRDILPLINDITLSKTFSLPFHGRDVDDKEHQNRAASIRNTNDVIFMICYIIARTFGLEYIFYRVQVGNSAFPFK